MELISLSLSEIFAVVTRFYSDNEFFLERHIQLFYYHQDWHFKELSYQPIVINIMADLHEIWINVVNCDRYALFSFLVSELTLRENKNQPKRTGSPK